VQEKTQWSGAGLNQFHLPEAAGYDWLTLVHKQDYVKQFMDGVLDATAMRRIGLPWSPELVKRTCTAVGGTVLTAQLALEHGIACSTAGGTHHAHAGFGSGFCIFNDMAVAARVMQRAAKVERVLIVDLDVHQGDGTAAIFAGDHSVFTFSVHCGKNFPFRKQPSDLDIALPVGLADVEYLALLSEHLPHLLDTVQPDLVFYDAGVDPHKDDLLGKLALSDAGISERDRYVLTACVTRDIPVACVVGGGYAHDRDRLARRHSLLHRAATDLVGW
jgi:acetoin utilization deacetylase AcuC-like enzyme